MRCSLSVICSVFITELSPVYCYLVSGDLCFDRITWLTITLVVLNIVANLLLQQQQQSFNVTCSQYTFGFWIIVIIVIIALIIICKQNHSSVSWSWYLDPVVRSLRIWTQWCEVAESGLSGAKSQNLDSVHYGLSNGNREFQNF